jgi:hypothetical protein
MEHTMTLLNQHAQPIPNKEIVERLKRIDERLDVLFIGYPSRDFANTNMTANFVIIQRWRQDDKRRQMIQLGQMSENDDFDILAWLPLDCSVEQAYDYFLRACKGRFKESRDIEYFLENIHKWNEAAKIPKEVKEYAEEMIEANVNTLFREQGKEIPKVYLAKGNVKK